VPPPAWWIRRDRSGGQVIEQTTHVLDLIRFLVGEVTEVSALESVSERADFPDADVPDVSAAVLRFVGGAVGSVCSSCLLPAKHRAGLEIVCDGLTIDLSEDSMTVSRNGMSEPTPAVADAKTQADRDFIDAVAGTANRIRAPYAEALRTHRLACALARSAADGRPVTLGEAAGV
jgi:predicted dehydrogenase